MCFRIVFIIFVMRKPGSDVMSMFSNRMFSRRTSNVSTQINQKCFSENEFSFQIILYCNCQAQGGSPKVHPEKIQESGKKPSMLKRGLSFFTKSKKQNITA